MKQALSKDFYVIITILLIFFMLFLILPKVMRSLDFMFNDDHKVINKYYGSINRGNYKSAYSLLANLVFKYKTNKGKKVDFDVRPDFKKFKKEHEKIKSIKVVKIQKEIKYSYPEVGLRCFKVEAIIKYKDIMVSPKGKTTIYIYTLNTGKKPLILGIRTTP